VQKAGFSFSAATLTTELLLLVSSEISARPL
jgi:hypothetical protein